MDQEQPGQIPPAPPASSPIPAFVREHWILLAGFLVAGFILMRGLMPEGGNTAPGGPGGKAADFTLTELDSAPVSLSSFRGNNVVILDFWATWCPPCRMSMPVLQKLKDSLGSRGLVVLSINQREDPDTVRAFIRQNGYNMRTLLDADGRVGGAWKVNGIPSLFVVDKEGNVRHQEVGYDSGMEARLTGIVSDLL